MGIKPGAKMPTSCYKHTRMQQCVMQRPCKAFSIMLGAKCKIPHGWTLNACSLLKCLCLKHVLHSNHFLISYFLFSYFLFPTFRVTLLYMQ